MKSMIIAFAMYSKIPMPKTEWTEKNMRYAMCWFPMIGVVIGIASVLVCVLGEWLSAGGFLKGVLLTMIPLILTGGIHMDGFMDTSDARGSYGDREKKLTILKDSHVGAFAVLACTIYLLVSAGFWSEASVQTVMLTGAGFVLSRAFSGFAVVTFKSARSDGLLVTFAKPAEKKTVQAAAILWGTAAAMLMIWIQPLAGAVCTAAAAGVFGYYRYFSYKEFGGITGDLAGYFVQVCELVMLAAAVIVQLLQFAWR